MVISQYSVGQRVTFHRDLAFDALAYIARGECATVTAQGPDEVFLKLDTEHPGLAYWGNNIWLNAWSPPEHISAVRLMHPRSHYRPHWGQISTLVACACLALLLFKEIGKNGRHDAFAAEIAAHLSACTPKASERDETLATHPQHDAATVRGVVPVGRVLPGS